jgi:hypothetical protein
VEEGCPGHLRARERPEASTLWVTFFPGDGSCFLRSREHGIGLKVMIPAGCCWITPVNPRNLGGRDQGTMVTGQPQVKKRDPISKTPNTKKEW